MPAYYNGVNLGLIFEMPVAANPKGRQINAYPGANGLEVIDHGSRGGSTFVSAALIGASTQQLRALEQQLRALQVDGGAYPLVDDLGTTWPGVILVQYQPTGRVFLTVDNYLARRYRAEFLHVY